MSQPIQAESNPTPWVSLRGIVKSFPGVLANDHIDLDIYGSEIHALLGENGAGKSTLMKILYGFYRADAGQILLNGHAQEYVIPTAIHQFAKTFQVPAVLLNLNWYHAVPDYFKTKDQGGPYETPFIHADEVETSWSLALLPEYVKQEDAVDTKPFGFLPEGHVPSAGTPAGGLQELGHDARTDDDDCNGNRDPYHDTDPGAHPDPYCD